MPHARGYYGRRSARTVARQAIMDAATWRLDFQLSQSLTPVKGSGTPTLTRAGNTATYVNSAGVITTINANLPRFDYDPATLNFRGLLLERAATNVCVRSGDISHAGWGKTRSSTPGTAITAPDGTATGYFLMEDTTATNTHQMQQQPVNATTVPHTFSIYAKAGTRTKFDMVIISTGGNVVSGLFDLSAGTVAASSVSGYTANSSRITAAGNGWYRCEVTATPNDTTALSVAVRLANASTSTYTGDGVSGAYFWGGQLELSSTATEASSYVPTTTASVTRAADQLSLAIASLTGFSTTEGTILMHGGSYSKGTSLAYAISAAGAFNNSIYGNVGGPTTYRSANVIVAGVAQTGDCASSTIVAGKIINDCFGWKANDFGVSTDGSAASVDTSGSLPASLDTLFIGSNWAGTGNFWNGWIQRLVYWNTKRTSAEIARLTGRE